MRITQIELNRAFVDRIFDQQTSLEDTRREISSGIRVDRPSDDPSRAASISQLTNTLNRIERHQQRTAFATHFLSQQETVLSSTQDIMLRAKELATQGANETLSTQQRAQMAAEVFALRDSLVSLANSKIQGVYIYGGADDDDPPYDANTYAEPADPSDPASVRYAHDGEDGTSTTRSVNITDDITVRLNTAGNDVFDNSVAALERLGRALAGYRTEPEDLSGLPTGAGAAFNFPNEYDDQTEDLHETIDLIQAALDDDIMPEMTDLGARLARVDVAKQILNSAELDTNLVRSEFQDADIFDAASRLTQLEASLQATLASGARINQLSLLNFI